MPQHPRFDAFMAHAKTSLDWSRIDAIRATTAEHRPNKLKYLDTRVWLKRMWREALDLELDRRPPCRILDIGSGPGHFPYVCRYLGHDAVALDQPGVDLHDQLREWMDIPLVAQRIRARTPLPAFRGRFDLVTAFRVGFNAKGDRKLFDLDDWSFFLDDVLANALTADGMLVLKMINQVDFDGLKFGDSALMDLFESRGGRAAAEGRIVRFAPLHAGVPAGAGALT